MELGCSSARPPREDHELVTNNPVIGTCGEPLNEIIILHTAEWALGAIIYETQRYQPCPTIGLLASSSTTLKHTTASQALLLVLCLRAVVLLHQGITNSH